MRISAVIAAYNYGRFVGRAVASILAQSVPCEVIIVDDGSTDDTPSVVADIRRRNAGAPIRYVRQLNAGPSAARNHGVRLAAGDWVAFLDADDYWYADKLGAQRMLAKQYPAAGLFFAGVDLEDAQGRLKRWIPSQTGPVRWEHLIETNLVPSPTPLVNKEVFFKAGAFDEGRRLSEDRDLWLRIAEVAPVVGQARALAVYSDHGGGLHRHHKMSRASAEVVFASLARRREQLSPALLRRALGSMAGNDAVAAAQSGDYRSFADNALRAVRCDVAQLPRMGWCGLFALMRRGRLYA